MPSKSKKPRSKRGGRPTIHRDLTVSWCYEMKRFISRKSNEFSVSLKPRYYWTRTGLEEVEPESFGGFTEQEQARFDRAMKRLIFKRRQLEMRL
jgi:hypothetical protein